MANAKGRERWDRLLTLGEFIVNSRPHFGKTAPPPMELMHLNPYRAKTQPKRSKGIPLTGSLGARILDACSVKEK